MDAGVVYDTDFVTATNADISMLSDIDGLNWTLLAITSCPHSVIYNLTKTYLGLMWHSGPVGVYQQINKTLTRVRLISTYTRTTRAPDNETTLFATMVEATSVYFTTFHISGFLNKCPKSEKSV